MALIEKYRKFPFKLKLAIAFTFIIVFNTIACLYYSNQMQKLTAENLNNQQIYYNINGLSTSLETMRRQAEIYVDQKRPQAYTVYAEERKNVEHLLVVLCDTNDYTVYEGYSLRAIKNTTENFIRDCNLLFWKINAKDPSYYITYYSLQNKMDYLSEYLSAHLNLVLTQNAVNQNQAAKQAEMSNSLNLAFLATNVLFCLFLTITFSGVITRPISALAQAAEKITAGDYNTPDLDILNDDEVGQLTRNFNTMKHSVESSIEHLNRRAELEAQLHQKELENLKMSQLLNEAQYLALQSQINPHFLFNTLNVIARSAVRDTPKTTTTLIYSLADLFRYNLNHLNNFSTLRDELEIVEKYIYIQKHRFGERISYTVNTEPECEDVVIPSMLLQPLVENAIIHGIEDLENGGKIVINVRRRKEHVLLRIYDNGVGIEKERLKSIYEGKLKHTGHTTGIGLSNILKRISIIDNASMKIKSGRHGTMIYILLPFDERK